MAEPTPGAIAAANQCLIDGPFKHNSPGRREAIALALDAFAAEQVQRERERWRNMTTVRCPRRNGELCGDDRCEPKWCYREEHKEPT